MVGRETLGNVEKAKQNEPQKYVQNGRGNQEHGIQEANDLINNDMRRILFLEYLLRPPGQIASQAGEDQ